MSIVRLLESVSDSYENVVSHISNQSKLKRDNVVNVLLREDTKKNQCETKKNESVAFIANKKKKNSLQNQRSKCPSNILNN